MKYTVFAVAAVVLLLAAACAPAVVTPDPAQIQASAVAAAGTMIAMTQAAVPTATDMPPTLEPSPTPFPLPTLDLFSTPSVGLTVSPTSSTGDDCNHLFDMAATGGKRSPVKINNKTTGSATLSLSMNTKNAFGQCGYMSFVIGKGQSQTVQLPQTGPGPCFWGYAWINGAKPSTAGPNGPFCWNNPDKWTLDIRPDTIKLTPP